MATFPATYIASGTRVPYHSTSRARLSDVTTDALRGAAIRLPSDDLRQTGPWFVRGHLKLSPEARSMLPFIMGGARRDVGYEVSAGSRGVILRAAENGTMRRVMAPTMDLDTMGFAAPARDGRLASPPPMVIGDSEEASRLAVSATASMVRSVTRVRADPGSPAPRAGPMTHVRAVLGPLMTWGPVTRVRADPGPMMNIPRSMLHSTLSRQKILPDQMFSSLTFTASRTLNLVHSI